MAVGARVAVLACVGLAPFLTPFVVINLEISILTSQYAEI